MPTKIIVRGQRITVKRFGDEYTSLKRTDLTENAMYAYDHNDPVDVYESMDGSRYWMKMDGAWQEEGVSRADLIETLDCIGQEMKDYETGELSIGQWEDLEEYQAMKEEGRIS